MVQAGNDVEVPGEAEILEHDVVHRHLRAEHREPQRQQPVVGGEAALAQPFDLAARHRYLAVRLLAGTGVGLRRSVQEQRPDAGVGEAVDRGVGMLGRRIVVVPVGDRGDAAIDLVERPDQIGDVDIVGPEEGRQPGVHGAEIVGPRPVAGEAAQCGLPGVDMAVDQARHDDHVGGVDHLDFVADCEVDADRGNLGTVDQHVAVFQIADPGIHRDDATPLDQQLRHGMRSVVAHGPASLGHRARGVAGAASQRVQYAIDQCVAAVDIVFRPGIG